VIGGRPRQAYFGREFHETLWRGFQALGAGAKRLVLAVLVVGTLYAFSGGSKLVLWGAVALAALVLFLLHQPKRSLLDDGMPTDDELRALDRLADQDDEMAAGNGHLEDPPTYSYEETIAELFKFVGRKVDVQVAAASDARAVGTLWGRLKRGISIGANDDDVTFFQVGTSDDGGFFVARERFEYAERLDEHAGHPALALHMGDVVVFVLDDEQNSRAPQALTRGRRRRPT
jgi:hypothetical protein